MAETLNRRVALGAGAGAFAAMMLQPGWLPAAIAQSAKVQADPRYAFVDRVSEITIPTTDTPGASAAGVPVFVLLAFDEGMNGCEPAMLTALKARLDADAGGAFMAKPAAEQAKILGALDAHAYAAPSAPGSIEYAWRRVKAAIIAGYYTSEIGATKELVFEPVPGGFKNITMGPDYRARSNDGFGGAF